MELLIPKKLPELNYDPLTDTLTYFRYRLMDMKVKSSKVKSLHYLVLSGFYRHNLFVRIITHVNELV